MLKTELCNMHTRYKILGFNWYAKRITRWQGFLSVDSETFTYSPTFHTADVVGHFKETLPMMINS